MSPQKKLIAAAAVLVFLGTWGSWKIFQTHRARQAQNSSTASNSNSQNGSNTNGNPADISNGATSSATGANIGVAGNSLSPSDSGKSAASNAANGGAQNGAIGIAQSTSQNGANSAANGGGKFAGNAGASNGSLTSAGGGANSNGSLNGSLTPGNGATSAANNSAANGAKIASQQQGSPAANPVPADSCLKVNFRHRALATHSSEDECSHHRNLLKLGRVDINPSTLCVRVNGTPVRHEFVSGKTDEVVIGPVAGPKDVITAKFCTGKIKCAEKCVYPAKEIVKRDEFLDAIGGTEDDKDTALAHWDGQDAEKTAEVHHALSDEVKKELEAREQAIKKVADAQNKMEIFKDWISETENGSCGVETAAVRMPAGKQ